MKKNKLGFTLVELLIAMTILNIFLIVSVGSLGGIINTILGLENSSKEQESMLFDNYILDEYSKEITNIEEVSYIDNESFSQTGYILIKNNKLFGYPFIFLGFNKNDNFFNLNLKRIVIFNDIIKYDGKIIYTNTGKNKIYNYIDNTEITSGTGLNNPTGLYIHGTDLYIADTGNSCIKKISNIKQCVYGKEGKSGLNSNELMSPTGITGDGQNLYVSDTYGHSIKKIDLITGNISTIFGNGESGNKLGVGNGIQLNLPTGIAYGSGFLYVADTGNHRILKLNTTSLTGSVFIGGNSNKSIKIKNDLTQINPSNLSINFPLNIKIYNNDLYFSEGLNGLIKKINLTSNNLENIVGSIGNIAHFGDFENTSINFLNSINLINFSGSYVSDLESIPNSGNNSLKLFSTANSNGDLVYNFSKSISPNEDQYIKFGFSLKTNSGAYNITYGTTSSNNFTSLSNTGVINEDWQNFYFYGNKDIGSFDGFKIQISNSDTGDIFYLDDFLVEPKNISINFNTSSKMENNFSYIGGIFIDGANVYFNDNIKGVLYTINGNSLNINGLGNKILYPYNMFSKYKSYDDYIGITSYKKNSIEKIGIGTGSILSLKIVTESKNGIKYSKNISIK